MINVLFITNILCRHQVGIWDPLSIQPDIHFTYLCTRNPKEEISIRYKCEMPRNYTINSFELDDDNLINMVNESDIIFYGSIEDNRVRSLISNKNNSFIITEHSSKDDYKEFFKLRGIRRWRSFKKNIKIALKDINKNYVFCASSHTGQDFSFAGANKNNLLKFGYFPKYDIIDIKNINNKDTHSIFYIGRDCTFKHPEVAIYALNIFNKIDGYRYNISFCGEGLDKYIDGNSYCNYYPSLNNRELMEKLKKSSIYIFPSDRGEGWGTVLGEAMAAGCVCFANIEAGSTRYLINDGVNGFTYKTKRELRCKIKKFVSMDKEKIKIMRYNAIKTVKSEWSGETAALRLRHFIDCYTTGTNFIAYRDGPLSLDK